MDDKPKGGLWMGVGVGGLMVACCAVPILLASGLVGFSGLIGWLGGLNPLLVGVVAVGVGLIAFGLMRSSARRRNRRVIERNATGEQV